MSVGQDLSMQKVLPQHLKRKAFLYIRQSTMRQTHEHQESTIRQYALRGRALALGWSEEDIVIIDDDQGQSGAITSRGGFQGLVSEVGLGHAGLVMSIDASRLARNCADWHRLIEICALSDTLILDEDGIYNPCHINDRLVLGLKGTLSEVELHMIRARLLGGLFNKAKRGELWMRLPIGFIYDSEDRVRFDTDKRVRDSIRLFFRTFSREGTLYEVVRKFNLEHLEFPKRPHYGPGKGELFWGPLTVSRASYIVHNPRYAGAYVFGRRKCRMRVSDGKWLVSWLPRDDWHTLIKDAHEGYITWEEYEENQKKLEANTFSKKYGRNYPPREGCALLQGLALCGVCGRRMDVRYRNSGNQLFPYYVCRGNRGKYGGSICQDIPGGGIDKKVSQLLLDAMTPVSLEVSLSVYKELQDRIEESDALRQKKVEQARYEAELCRRRFMRVDPDNRLVAEQLESEWNGKLREHNQALEEYKRLRESDRKILNEETKTKVMELASDFPRLWNDSCTPHRDRKRMIRLLLEDVTLIKKERIIIVHVRFKGGMIKSLEIDKPLSSYESWTTDPSVVIEIDRLLNEHTYDDIAEILNEGGFLSGKGNKFDGKLINRIRLSYCLENRFDRLRKKGFLTAVELGSKMGICSWTVRKRRAQGKINGYKVFDSGQYLYENIDKDKDLEGVVAGRAKEVQYE